MKSRFLDRTPFLLLLPLLLVFCWLVCARDVITAPMSTAFPQGCSPNSFYGTWLTQNGSDSLQIGGSGGTFNGTVNVNGVTVRTIKGTISGNTLTGTWYIWDPDGGRAGSFTAKLNSAAGRIDGTFNEKGMPTQYGVWFCSQPQPPPTYTPTPDITPTPTPTPRPPGAWMIRDDQDQDNFETFDSLPPAEQALVLTRRGPRLRVDYDANDFAMRVLVNNGTPLVIDYGLHSDRAAELNVEVPEGKPLYARLHPTERATITFPMAVRSRSPVVAKLTIRAFNSMDEPADFELYGISVGERGHEALRKADHDVQLAFNSFSEREVERLPLFKPAPDALSLRIQVDLPSTLKVKQKPEQKILFTCISGADFSDGRWEWWRVEGLRWTKVWQHGTKSLSRNQTVSEDWNGIITSRKLVSSGSHALQMTAWQKSGNDRDSIVVRAPSRLTVIE